MLMVVELELAVLGAREEKLNWGAWGWTLVDFAGVPFLAPLSHGLSGVAIYISSESKEVCRQLASSHTSHPKWL